MLKTPLAQIAHRIPAAAVTDFGGATGPLGASYLVLYPDAQYTVVENPTLVVLMNRSAHRQSVRFSSKIPEQCDVFNISGTLEYLADPMTTLAEGLKSARHSAVVYNQQFSDTESFLIQKTTLFANGGGPVPLGYQDCEIRYPRRTIIEADVHALAEKLGFGLIAAIGDTGAPSTIYSRQLVFWRRSPNPS